MLSDPDPGQELSEGRGQRAGKLGLLHLYHPGDLAQTHTPVTPDTAKSPITRIYNLTHIMFLRQPTTKLNQARSFKTGHCC